MESLIIGITGTSGAGKNTVVDHLVKRYGFNHYSSRAFIQEEIVKRDLEDNRDSMIVVANDLRATFGSSYIIQNLWKQARAKGGNAVIESIRTLGEVDFLKRHADFYLLAVTADPQIRYKRILGRGSSTDHITFDHFLEQERLEMQSKDPNKQNLHETIKQANFVIYNNGTLPELETQVEEVLKKIEERRS